MLRQSVLAVCWFVLQQSGTGEQSLEAGGGQRSYSQSAYKKIRANSLLAQGKPLVWPIEPKGAKEQAFTQQIAAHLQYVASLDALSDAAVQQKQTTWLEPIETYRRLEIEYYFRAMRAYRLRSVAAAGES